MTLEIWNTIFQGILASGVGIAVWQLALQRRAWREEHERARREKAVEILRRFIESDCEWWSASRKLIDRLGRPALEKLVKGEPFTIESELEGLLFAAIPTAFTESERIAAKFPLELTTLQVFALRWHAYSFLNAAEIVFQAWRSDVAHSEMVLEEMRPYYEPGEGRTLMRGLRDAADGKNAWPALQQFVETVSLSGPEKRPIVVETVGR